MRVNKNPPIINKANAVIITQRLLANAQSINGLYKFSSLMIILSPHDFLSVLGACKNVAAIIGI